MSQHYSDPAPFDCVLIKHGTLVSDVVCLGADGRYAAGTWLPETKKLVLTESGRLAKSWNVVVSTMRERGYEDGPMRLFSLEVSK